MHAVKETECPVEEAHKKGRRHEQGFQERSENQLR